MGNSDSLVDRIGDILDDSFQGLRDRVYDPAIDRLDRLEQTVVENFLNHARSGEFDERELLHFVKDLKIVIATRVAVEHQLHSAKDDILRQLRARK
jgi:hypothetical protein